MLQYKSLVQVKNQNQKDTQSVFAYNSMFWGLFFGLQPSSAAAIREYMDAPFKEDHQILPNVPHRHVLPTSASIKGDPQPPASVLPDLGEDDHRSK